MWSEKWIVAVVGLWGGKVGGSGVVVDAPWFFHDVVVTRLVISLIRHGHRSRLGLMEEKLGWVGWGMGRRRFLGGCS